MYYLLENKKIMDQKYVEQTGFLYKFDPADYVLGASPLIMPEIMQSADWREFVPEGEIQARMFVFDTMSCTTFSALNIVETWFNYHIKKESFTVAQLETLNQLGYFKNGRFNCSDRFTAIMSKTMKTGNYFQAVWDSIRKDGLLPENDLPFDPNFKTWDEYHNPNAITQAMKDKAVKILDIMEFNYEWNTTDIDYTGLIEKALKSCPVHGAVPAQARHAIEIIAPKFEYDSYDPFIKPLPTVRYSMKTLVTVKKPIVNEFGVMIKREKGNGKETLGTLIARNGQSVFACKTLELPWLNNAKNISCVPVGTYLCKRIFSLKYGYVYALQNVKGRSGIYIHIGNYFSDIAGCIILGNAFADINKDGVLDVINSTITVKALHTFMQKKNFTLTIV
jgi:hypothetical protein